MSDSPDPPPLRWSARRGEARPLRELEAVAGPALGLVPDHHYTAVEVGLDEGDRVVLLTDGLLEAGNAQGEEFGLERAAEVLAGAAGRPIACALEGLVAAASAHAGSDRFGDDVCLLAIELGSTA